MTVSVAAILALLAPCVLIALDWLYFTRRFNKQAERANAVLDLATQAHNEASAIRDEIRRGIKCPRCDSAEWIRLQDTNSGSGQTK